MTHSPRQPLGEFRICTFPRPEFFLPFQVAPFQFLSMTGEVFAGLLRNIELLVWKTHRLAGCVHKLYAGLAMSFVCSRNFRDAFANQRPADDELRFTALGMPGFLKNFQESFHVIAINGVDLEFIRLEALGGVFALRFY